MPQFPPKRANTHTTPLACTKAISRDPLGTLCSQNSNTDDHIRVVVGDSVFLTTRATLTKREPNCVLAKAFAKSLALPQHHHRGVEIVFDRDPALFLLVLNYLRTGKLPSVSRETLRALDREAEFYGCVRLQAQIQALANSARTRNHPTSSSHANTNTENTIPDTYQRSYFNDMPPRSPKARPVTPADDLMFDMAL